MNGLTRHITLEQPVMMRPIFAQLRRGPGDTTHRWLGDLHLRATRTPSRTAPRCPPAPGVMVRSGALTNCRGCSAEPTIRRHSGRGLSTDRWWRPGNAMAITE